MLVSATATHDRVENGTSPVAGRTVACRLIGRWLLHLPRFRGCGLRSRSLLGDLVHLANEGQSLLLVRGDDAVELLADGDEQLVGSGGTRVVVRCVPFRADVLQAHEGRCDLGQTVLVGGERTLIPDAGPCLPGNLLEGRSGLVDTGGRDGIGRDVAGRGSHSVS